MNSIVFIGPQGSGKGTQVELLAEAFQAAERSVATIQTGEIFRSFSTETGYVEQVIQEHINAGHLMPDVITNGLVVERVLHVITEDQILLFDGYPRNRAQVQILMEVLAFFGRSTIDVIHLDTPNEVVTTRMQARNRSDDTADSIKARLQTYHQETEPLLDVYRGLDEVTLHTIDGAQSIAAVQAEIAEKLSVPQSSNE